MSDEVAGRCWQMGGDQALLLLGSRYIVTWREACRAHLNEDARTSIIQCVAHVMFI